MEKNISQPFDQETEEAVLGALLLEKKQWLMLCLFCERRCFIMIITALSLQLLHACTTTGETLTSLLWPTSCAVYKVATDKESGYPTEGLGILSIPSTVTGKQAMYISRATRV